MQMLLDILGGLLLVTGASFLLFGGLGLVRMPDLFNRIQAGAKTTTLGTLLTLSGTACLHPEWVLKLLLVGVFLLFTNPLSSQVLARVSHHSGVIKTKKMIIDALSEDHREKS